MIKRKEAKGDKINCDYLVESRHLTALSDFWGETNGACNFALRKDNLSLFPQPSQKPGRRLGLWQLKEHPQYGLGRAGPCYFSLQVSWDGFLTDVELPGLCMPCPNRTLLFLVISQSYRHSYVKMLALLLHSFCVPSMKESAESGCRAECRCWVFALVWLHLWVGQQHLLCDHPGKWDFLWSVEWWP